MNSFTVWKLLKANVDQYIQLSQYLPTDDDDINQLSRGFKLLTLLKLALDYHTCTGGLPKPPLGFVTILPETC